MKTLKTALEAAEEQHLYRRRRVLDSPQQPRLVVDGHPMLSFCSNDYLGLANDRRIAAAFRSGIDRWGNGSGAAHLVTGHSRAHHALEEELADFTGRQRALLFSSGYLANLAVVTSLCGRGDTVIQDKLDHASLIDAARLSGADLKRYPHNDMTGAQQRLDAARGETLLTVDGVFSMDGDLADLPALAELCGHKGAWLMVDDAHGLGVLDEQGRGSLAHFSLNVRQAPVLMGTLGKAFGTAGAFVAGDEDLVETLIQKGRSYIFTTALPAAVAEATRASLTILRTENWRREKLRDLVARFRRGARQLGFELPSSITPIQPLVAGSAQTALAWSRILEEQGLLVTAIRPPTVPEGSARLRITFSAAHEEKDVDALLGALEAIRP